MPSHISRTFLSFLLACSVNAHGRIDKIVADGVTYAGWNPESALNQTGSPPQLAAWSADNLGNIFVPPSQFNTSHITCHFNATPGQSYIDIQAGHSIELKWNEWPVSHKGPVITYIAPCNGSCTTVDKNQLEFVKIEEQGWLNASDPGNDELGGTWASDVLIANNFTWSPKLPANLAAGNYVLRHEIIALHVANETDGAQNYPQCLNLRVSNNASSTAPAPEVPTGGELATEFYKMDDAGILVDIHHTLTGYSIPGPALWKGAAPSNATGVEEDDCI